MKTIGQTAYEIFRNCFEERYGNPCAHWESLPKKSQLVWEAAAVEMRALQGPFAESPSQATT